MKSIFISRKDAEEALRRKDNFAALELVLASLRETPAKVAIK